MIFKRKKKDENTVTSNKSQETVKEVVRQDELKVEENRRNYIIFSDTTQKYLCLDGDFNNLITFEDYKESCQGSLILRKDNSLGLLYFSNELGKYTFSDFIFKDIVEEKYLLLLTTDENAKHLYCLYNLYNDICDYITYDFDESCELILIKFHDHDELYKRYFYQKLDLLFSAKSIELCSTQKKDYLCNWNAIFTYKVNEDKLINYFIVENAYLSDICNKNSYISLDVVNYNDDRVALIGTNELGKKCIFDMYSPDKTSKYYDSIQISNKLLLCKDSNHVEIIDMKFNVYYQDKFVSDTKLALEYNESSDSYILTSNDTQIITLHIHDNYFYNLYSIFKVGEDYGTFYSFEPQLSLPEFIMTCENDIFEFKDEYLKIFPDYYAFYEKDIISDKESYTLTSKHLKNILFINDDSKTFYSIGLNSIHLLQKCSVSEIESVYITAVCSMLIVASNPICNMVISGDNLKVNTKTGEEFELNVSDIKTNLNDYIFENINNKFSIAYLKYMLNW